MACQSVQKYNVHFQAGPRCIPSAHESETEPNRTMQLSHVNDHTRRKHTNTQSLQSQRLAQLFVQCFHQFTPLAELQKLGAQRKIELLKKYRAYVAHVSRTEYSDPETWRASQQETRTNGPSFAAPPWP